MLEYFRERMGVLLWVVLVLVIGGFVFMGAGSGFSFDFSTSLYVIGNETVTDQELKKFSKDKYATYLFTNIKSLQDEINRELESETPQDNIIQQFQTQIEEAQTELDRMATQMAWARELEEDGVEVSIAQASEYLKGNPTQAWLTLKSDGGNFLEGLEMTPKGKDLLRSYAHQRSKDLQQQMYQACFNLPMSFVYSGQNQPHGFRYDSIRVSSDYVSLPLNRLSTFNVSFDETKLKNFYDNHKNEAPSKRTVGYKKPGTYSLTCLVAVSQDFTASVETDAVTLRKFYDTQKHAHWKKPKEKDSFFPFREVREKVEQYYRLSEGKKLAKEHLEKMVVKWKEGASEEDLRDSHNLQLHRYEDILRDDVTWIPDLDNSITESDADSLEAGDIFATAKIAPQGAVIFRLDDKTIGQAPEFETIKDQVKEDFLIEKRLAKARELLSTFKNKWDEGTNFKEASDALIADAVKLSEFDIFGSPDVTPLGTIQTSDSIEKIHGFSWLQPQLLRNVFSKKNFSTTVEVNHESKEAFLIIAKDHYYERTNSQGESFSDIYNKTHERSLQTILRNFEAQYTSSLHSQKVKRLK